MKNRSKTDLAPRDEAAALKRRIEALEQSEPERKRAKEETAILAEIGRVIG